MENEHVYLRNLVDVHLSTAVTFYEECNYKNAIHRCQTAIYHIKQLIKLIKEKDEYDPSS